MISAALEFRRDRASTAHARFDERGQRKREREREARTVEVGVADVHVVYALIGEAGRHLLALLLDVEDEREEAVDVGGGDIVAVGALDEWFALEVEDRYQAGHARHSSRPATVSPASPSDPSFSSLIHPSASPRASFWARTKSDPDGRRFLRLEPKFRSASPIA